MCDTSEKGKQNSSLEKYNINIYKGKFYEISVSANFASEDERAPLRHNLSIFPHSYNILSITLQMRLCIFISSFSLKRKNGTEYLLLKRNRTIVRLPKNKYCGDFFLN